MDKLWRGAFSNPLMKHHGGTMKDHLLPDKIEPVDDELAEEYDEEGNDVAFASLTRLGNGRYSLLVRVFVTDMGMGVGTYDYIVEVGDTTKQEFEDFVRRYGLDNIGPPYYDLEYALALIVAAMLGVDIDDLKAKEFRSVPQDIIDALREELREQRRRRTGFYA